MTAKTLAPILLALLLVGCVDQGPRRTEPGPEPTDPDGGGGALFAHDSTGKPLDPLAIMRTVPSLDHVNIGVNGSEATIGVTSNGMIFLVGLGHLEEYQVHDLNPGLWVEPETMRSDDGGLTWRNVAPPLLTGVTTLDPYLFVDPVTDRVFVDHLYVGCSHLSFSDDFGETWITNPAACGAPINDHQKLTTGPFRAPLVASPAYPNVVYYGYSGHMVVYRGNVIAMSFDGGVTWPVSRQALPHTECALVNGDIHASADGYVYVPKRDCDGVLVSVSADNGMTWNVKAVGKDVGMPEFWTNPDIGTDTSNNVYLVRSGKDNRVHLSVSRDHGESWSARSLPASPPEITTAAMATIIAGDAGRIAFAYYGVRDGNGDVPECVGVDARWDLYVTWSLNALDENPTFVTVRANAAEDPVQIGGIDTVSGTPPASCQYRRNLLDFIDITMDKQGRVYVGSGDGCLKCAGFEESVMRDGVSSTQVTGPSLLATVADFASRPLGARGG